MMIVVEFPIVTVGVWVALNWFTSSGYLWFLFCTLTGPVFLISLLLAYLFLDSRLQDSDAPLGVPYHDWIVLKEEHIK